MIIGSFSAFLLALSFLTPLIFQFSTGKEVRVDYIGLLLLFIPVLTLSIYIYLLLRDRALFYLNSLATEKLSPFQRTLVILSLIHI